MADTRRTTTEMDADADVVWEVLTSPDGVEEWLGPDSHLEPIEGADLDVADVETGVRRHGRVEQVDPGRSLTYVWWPADPDDGAGATRVVIELVPHEGGTTFVVTEAPATGTLRLAAPSATASVAGTWAWRGAAVELSLLARGRPVLAA